MDKHFNELLLNCILEDSVDAVAAVDAGRRIGTWSAGASLLLGHARTDMVGHDFAELFSDDTECEIILAAANEVPLLRNRESLLVRKDGSLEKIYITIRALKSAAQTQPEGFLVEMAPAETEFAGGPDHKAVQDTLLRMERFSAIGRMAAAFAHEMRSPLHVISSTAEFGMEYLAPDSKMRESLGMILRNARHASLSVQALLEFSKVGKSHLREGSINDILRAALRLLEKMCEKQNIVIDLQLAQLPGLLIDEQHMRAVVHNLLVNAIEAMPEGGSLKVRTEPVPSDKGARVVVEDTGVGMSAEVLSQAGSAFFTSKENGTGLGLYLSKRILAEHGAELGFDSSRGRGTRAVIRFGPKSVRK